jgi:hypothetical protein
VSGFEIKHVDLVEPVTRDATVAPIASSARTLSPLQTLFLSRLSRELHQEVEWRQRVASDDWRLRLLRHAIYTSYCDCVAADLADEARDLVRRSRGTMEIQPSTH